MTEQYTIVALVDETRGAFNLLPAHLPSTLTARTPAEALAQARQMYPELLVWVVYSWSLSNLSN